MSCSSPAPQNTAPTPLPALTLQLLGEEARSGRETQVTIATCVTARDLYRQHTCKPRVLSVDAPELPAAQTANPVSACLVRPDMSVVDGQAGGGMDMEQLRRVALLSMMR